MTVTAFELEHGVSHGRSPSTTALDGTHVFELGSAFRGIENLSDGDHCEISQAFTGTFTSGPLARIRVVLKAPVLETAGATWVFTVTNTASAVTYYTRRIAADGRELVISSIGVPIIGTVNLRLRLALEIV